jgi:hypothetical protein
MHPSSSRLGGKIILEPDMYPKSKAELLESTYSEREKLEKKISGLTPEEMIYPGSMGEWSVKDILQHLVDWEQRWINWYESGKRGQEVHTPEQGYNWRQMGLLNENYRLKHKDRPLNEVMADFFYSYQQILKVIEKIPEHEMLSTGVYLWTGKLPLIAWIAGNTCEHYHWAIQMIHPQTIRRKMNARKDQ